MTCDDCQDRGETDGGPCMACTLRAEDEFREILYQRIVRSRENEWDD